MQLSVNADRCSGCRLCQQICAIEHQAEINPRKAAIRIRAEFPVPGRFVPELCNQCGECASACPADAIQEKNSVYIIDPELCTGCGECVDECPSKALHFPGGVSCPIKCDLCFKCVDICNTGALVAVGDLPTGKELPTCTDSEVRLSA